MKLVQLKLKLERADRGVVMVEFDISLIMLIYYYLIYIITLE